MKAVAKAERLVGEDILREAGFMLPQSDNAHQLLAGMLANAKEGFPKESCQKLLDIIPNNEKEKENKNYGKMEMQSMWLRSRK